MLSHLCHFFSLLLPCSPLGVVLRKSPPPAPPKKTRAHVFKPIDVVSRAVDRIAEFLEAVVHERVVTSELDQLRQRQQRQRHHLQRRHQPQLLEAASAAVAAVFASTAAYASAAVRGIRSAAGAVKGKDRQEEEARRSSVWGDRPGARRSGYSAGTPREGFRRREKQATGGGGSGSAGGGGGSKRPKSVLTASRSESELSRSIHGRPVVDTVPW